MTRISIDNEELKSIREATRSFPYLIRTLNEGVVAKYVIMRRNKIVAVILDIDDYTEMVEKAKNNERLLPKT